MRRLAVLSWAVTEACGRWDGAGKACSTSGELNRKDHVLVETALPLPTVPASIPVSSTDASSMFRMGGSGALMYSMS